jgi:hypothetical protein
MVGHIRLRENFLSDIPDCISPIQLSFISFATNRLMAMFFVIGVHNKFLFFYLYKIPSGTTTSVRSFFLFLYLFDLNQSYVQDE